VPEKRLISFNNEIANLKVDSPYRTPGISTVIIKVKTKTIRHAIDILGIMLSIIAKLELLKANPEK